MCCAPRRPDRWAAGPAATKSLKKTMLSARPPPVLQALHHLLPLEKVRTVRLSSCWRSWSRRSVSSSCPRKSSATATRPDPTSRASRGSRRRCALGGSWCWTSEPRCRSRPGTYRRPCPSTPSVRPPPTSGAAELPQPCSRALGSCCSGAWSRRPRPTPSRRRRSSRPSRPRWARIGSATARRISASWARPRTARCSKPFTTC
mmetsp:Transcript_9714/g.24269  ORF Transcript_9714/g.24269 Transcript_9714/m.24269 type:complete len:203 (+) Transcript_9714:727-1335(+)